MADPVTVATGILALLQVIAPLVPDLHPAIVLAVETKDETLARRLIQEAIERQEFEAERIVKSAKAPKRGRKPAKR
jgi:hypothetical protein